MRICPETSGVGDSRKIEEERARGWKLWGFSRDSVFWRSLRNRDYRQLWLAATASRLGFQASRAALLMSLFQRQDALPTIAWLAASEALSGMLFSPLCAMVVDRLPKKALIVLCEIFRAFCLGAILCFPGTKMIYGMIFCYSLGTVIFEAARYATVPAVLSKQLLTSANALEEAITHITMILGPLLGTMLYILGGLSWALTFCVGTSCLSGLLVVAAPYRDCPPDTSEAKSDSSLSDGLKYFSHHVIARHLALLSFIGVVSAGLWWPLAPFFMRESLNTDASFVAVQASIFGLGGIIGAIIAPPLTQRIGRGRLIVFSLLGEAATMLIYSLSHTLFFSTLICAVWGGAVALLLVANRSILQETIARNFLGRAFSITTFVDNGAILVAAGLAIPAHRAFGAQNTYCLFALVYLAGIGLSTITRAGRQLYEIH